MSAIVNTRDLLLQATSPRLVPIPIPISSIEGLDSALANAGRRVDITATSSTFAGVNNPTSITLTAELKGGLTGTVVWSVVTGALTLSPSGNTCVINNTSMTTASAVIRARVTVDGINYDGKYTLTKLGSLAAQDYVNLQTQVAGQLNSGNVTGLGALALLNTVNLNTQVTGALDATTQVNNLGALAYVNGLAANQIGAGQLAAGVVYAGQIIATQIKSGSFAGETFTGGTFSGTNIQTNTGTIGGVRINANGLNTGGYSGYAWPASGQNGFHLGPYGLLLGNANDGKYFQVTSDGNIYAPGFSVVGGNATFSGSLSAATGSFSGSLTANAINAVDTINIAGNAVSTMYTDTGNRSATIVVNVPAGEVWEAQLLGSWQGLKSATYWATGSDEPRYEITGGVSWPLFSIVTPYSDDGYSTFPIPSLTRSSRVTLYPGANTLSCSLYFPGGNPSVETTLIAFVRKR